jgi:hypothetical protein
LAENGNKGLVLESGKIFVSTAELDILEVNVASGRLDVDIEDKAFIKRVIELRKEISAVSPAAKQSEGKKKSSGPIASLRSVAEALSNNGITLTVSFKGDPIVTLGVNANPTLLQLITGTRAIAINSLYGLIKMII